MNYRIRLVETDEGWSVSCLDLPGCHSQGSTRAEALQAIREAIADWIAVEAEEAGIKSAKPSSSLTWQPHRETVSKHSKEAVVGSIPFASTLNGAFASVGPRPASATLKSATTIEIDP